jgi:hypothetical protein
MHSLWQYTLNDNMHINMKEGRMIELEQKIRATPVMLPIIRKEVTRSHNVPRDIAFSYEIRETNSLNGVFAEIEQDIVKSIVESDTKDLEVTFNRYLSSFKPKFEKVSKTIMMLEKESQHEGNDIELAKRIARLEYHIYEEIKQYIRTRRDISHDIPIRILEVIDNLSDYENVLFGIIINKPHQLPIAITKVDIDDLERNIVGAYQAFFCIIYIISHQEYNHWKLSKLIDLALKYSKEMDSYIDTLDIMTDAEEIDTINKSEEYYNKS